MRELVINGGRSAIRAFGTATAAFRPDPDFLVIGAKRGGSTSFYFDLLSHPQVAVLFPRPDRLPKATATKGIHYFDSNYRRGHRWYASHLPSRRSRHAQEVAAGGAVVVGEASPYYLTHPLAAERVARDLPAVRIIAVLRDPVLRAHSHWKERTRERRETLTFLEALRRENERVGEDADRLRTEPAFYSYPHEHQTYLGQSRYGAALERWLDLLPASSFHVVRSEDYYADPTAALDETAAFLGIAPGRFVPGEAKNAAPGDPVDGSARAYLEEHLRDDALLLRKRTGLTWDWV